jgi:hypothetical protein
MRFAGPKGNVIFKKVIEDRLKVTEVIMKERLNQFVKRPKVLE